MISRDARVIGLIGTGHFLSHFYMLCLPPLFPLLRDEFGVPYAALGLSVALMSAVTALLQTPVGFLVDRHGARPFLVAGNLLMCLTIAAMAAAQEWWVIVALAALSGVGNSVIHPADYAILATSVSQVRMGRAFSIHTFLGNLGFALAPPAIALLVPLVGWRGALLALGLLGLPVVLAILWQSRILRDEQDAHSAKVREAGQASSRGLLLSRPLLLFFGFMMLTAMAGAGIQAFLVTVLHYVQGVGLATGAVGLTFWLVGNTGGVLLGGIVADGTRHHLPVTVALLLAASGIILAIGTVAMPEPLLFGGLLFAGTVLGMTRPSRDLMVRAAAPPGTMGRVFGFVSAGLPLGQAITPVPFGGLIDGGHAGLVLPMAAGLLVLASLTVIAARGAAIARPPVAVPAE